MKMNPSSSYTIPSYPQLDSQKQNQTRQDNNGNGNSHEKHVLYYSQYCNHSKKVLETLQKSNNLDKVNMICIDYRFMKDNITYVKLPNNQNMPLPPMVNCVPTLCLVPNFEVLTGNKIINYFNPINENIQQERNAIDMQPNPFSLEKETIGSYGVSSDSFSFYDANHEELSASGNGGTRQMYNYSSVTQGNSNEIYTPQDQGKEQKLSLSMEQIQARRNNEL